MKKSLYKLFLLIDGNYATIRFIVENRGINLKYIFKEGKYFFLKYLYKKYSLLIGYTFYENKGGGWMNPKKMLSKFLLLTLSLSSFAAGLTEAERIIDDTNNGKYKGYRVSASSEVLTVEKNGVKKTYNMPADKFYLAAAPYIKETHP